ncbi:diguanylate cyclase (GGDEF) domain-containing protein [Pseudomonas peli]|jgi:diguanylate cyclase (GGDEF)-like protein|uniref:diguanylate cyclase n=1 Tax=Pseudomonas peli TaxID=592361 RepID=A0AB37Z4B2_9PSED|nr:MULTISPECIES: GGDEF domain-containing protein [Pseudomonas]MDR7022813.1 diguanylate cyclase (GGDEF)-like protein [Pseudomonas peli]NMZ69225.1 GGDEF domain-containing protein [Pseudomonas peli]PJE43408.1 MAG: GGDEF domain-containing protein [Pseudomonas sp.] [Pseudomonas sp. FEMGT703P]SCW33438.1 diguanylate cyclase (GGDEF) domain-containing protein [Pseudomonas peli]VXC27121.1 GGDEF domain protein [Pseudomonas sp. 9AZ]|tara:strand:- start:65599 stop:66525 length:927 start_codon:yes stop_codon:yes gene_type:complete
MAPHNQSNTIDFDAAKLQRLGYAGRLQKSLKPVSLAQLRQQLSLRLQTSLEAERILELFYSEVQRLVPLSSLSYQLASCDLRLELGERANHSAGYRLNHDGEFLGELTFRRNVRFSEDELGQLESLLASLLFPLRNALLYRAAVQSALRDPLTETGNRIAMQQTLKREVDIARRTLQPLSVLMVDIDHFKRINDTHGHLIGDQALKAVASALKESLRNVDMVFRFGGEEFMVLLSNTNREAASMVGERLRMAVLGIQYLVENRAIELSVSLGCATLLPGESMESLLRRADNALYVSKRDGRNRLSMAG